MQQTREQAIRKVQFAKYEPMDILECPKCETRWVISRGTPAYDYQGGHITLPNMGVTYDVAECCCGELFASLAGTEFIFGIPKR